MYKETYACDITQNKNIEQLFEFIGNFFCDPKTHESYRIIGLTKDSFICHRTIGMYDEDAFFGSGYYAEAGYILVHFNDNKHPYSLPATPKQKEWLNKHDSDSEISGVEAWHIINKTINEAKARYERKKYEYEHRWDDLDPEDDAYFCEYYDIPNM